jgi:hypothetical protein
MPTTTSTRARCARCGRPAAEDDLVCPLCGELRATPPRPVSGVWTGEEYDFDAVPAPAPKNGRWLVLGVGVLLAPVLTLTPLLRYVGWFLASLVHETGHTAVAWLFGCPAFPAIRLDGHAAALHREQMPILCVFVIAGLLFFAWSSRGNPRRLVLATACLALYPLLAFTEAHEALFLLGGHFGELAFAAYALSQAIDGGFTGSLAERCTHAGVGCYLLGRTSVLALGLLTSDTARAHYETSGSFGLENDLLRLSRSCLHTASPAPGALLLLALALGIAVFALVKASRAPEPEEG